MRENIVPKRAEQRTRVLSGGQPGPRAASPLAAAAAAASGSHRRRRGFQSPRPGPRTRFRV